jgi:hypothetical protein
MGTMEVYSIVIVYVKKIQPSKFLISSPRRQTGTAKLKLHVQRILNPFTVVQIHVE